MTLQSINFYGISQNAQNPYLASVTPPPQIVCNPTTTSHTASTSFKAAQPDVVQISAENQIKKEKGNKGLKILAGVGAGLTLMVGTAIAIAYHQSNKIAKLYKDKLVLSNLAEHIEFKEAKTVEEGIKYAKEVLGIKEVSKDFTLDAINTVNKGLVDVANANKGKLFMPTKLRFESDGFNSLAYVVNNVKSSEFGNMVVNKDFFNDEFLTNILDKRYELRKYAPTKIDKEVVKTIKEELPNGKEINWNNLIKINWSDEYHRLYSRYTTNAANLSVAEKRELYGIVNETAKEYTQITTRSPLRFLKNNQKLFEKNGININIEEIQKLSTKEQCEKAKQLCKEITDKGTRLFIDSSKYNQSKSIHHEMGHLQDFAKNLKKLELSEMEKLKHPFKSAMKKDYVDELANRWSKKGEENIDKLFEKDSEKFKKYYPDLYEFLTNQEIQQSAGVVSAYAQKGIGEFIAETYAGLISGKNYPVEVAELYKKYNGPRLCEFAA